MQQRQLCDERLNLYYTPNSISLINSGGGVMRLVIQLPFTGEIKNTYRYLVGNAKGQCASTSTFIHLPRLQFSPLLFYHVYKFSFLPPSVFSFLRFCLSTSSFLVFLSSPSCYFFSHVFFHLPPYFALGLFSSIL